MTCEVDNCSAQPPVELLFKEREESRDARVGGSRKRALNDQHRHQQLLDGESLRGIRSPLRRERNDPDELPACWTLKPPRLCPPLPLDPARPIASQHDPAAIARYKPRSRPRPGVLPLQAIMTAAPSDYELLTEHFSYPPVSLLDDIINAVNTLADRALESVERLLLSIPPQKLGFSAKKSKGKNYAPAAPDLPPDEAAHLEIENGTHQLETLLNASIDKTFDVFELYVMQNILNVRPQDQPFMRLSHYAGLDLQQLDAPDRPTPESITGLRRRLQASQKLNAVLEAEKARNDALLASLRGLLGAVHPADGIADVNANGHGNRASMGGQGHGVTSEGGTTAGAPFAFLRDRAGLEEGGGAQPITTTAEFTLSQLQALRSLSTSLKALLPDLTAAVAADADTNADAEAQGPKSWRRERAEYIESSSRKYLETVSGLELSAAGEVRDGDWQGQGRVLSKADVEGLEKIVALLEDNDGDGTPSPGAGDAMNQDE